MLRWEARRFLKVGDKADISLPGINTRIAGPAREPCTSARISGWGFQLRTTRPSKRAIAPEVELRTGILPRYKQSAALALECR